MALEFRNGSQIRPGGATEAAGHGVQGDLINVDEVWSLSKLQAKNLKDGFIPTTTTRLKLTGVRPQIWWTSTEGNGGSEYLNDRLDRLRAGDIPDRTAFFDFGIPFDADPEDLETIWRYHPGAGHLVRLRPARRVPPAVRRRRRGLGASVRQHPRRRHHRARHRFRALARHPRTRHPAGARAQGVFRRGSGHGGHPNRARRLHRPRRQAAVVQIVQELDGTGTAPARLLELQERYNAPICIDRRGPSAALADVLARELDPDTWEPVYRLTDMRASDAVTAPQSFLSALEQKGVAHAPTPWPTNRCARRRNARAATPGYGTAQPAT